LNQSERNMNWTQSNSNRSIVFRSVQQSNIIEQELLGEFDYRTREFDFQTQSNQSNLIDAISSILFGSKTTKISNYKTERFPSYTYVSVV